MNFIDISSWQRGLDLSALFRQNPIDGVIVKTSGGASYTQDTADQWIQWLIQSGKPWGFYHYMNDDNKGSSGKAEAEFFVSRCRSYFGKGMPFADYEGKALAFGTYYLKAFLDTVSALTGVKCGVYCSLSVVHEQDFSEIAKAGYPLWVAQYADNNIVNGFIEHPWQSGSVTPFSRYVMHQYTSCGRLNGYNGNLDFDQFCGSYALWLEMARGEAQPTPAPAPTPTPTTLKPADPQIVLAVLKNEYGIGQKRVNKLRAAGYDPADVQTTINRIYGIANKVKQDIGKDMSYLNSILWIARS